MADWQEIVAANNAQYDFEEASDITTTSGETGVSDYLFDIVRAPVGGISDALQGLITLGVLPFDIMTDKDLTGKIDKFFDETAILNTEAETGLGKIVQGLVQFGVPLGVASKVGSGVKLLRAASETKKLSSLPSLGAKGAEIAKRAGYWGALGGITDTAVNVPTKNASISDMVGLTEAPNFNDMTGKELAAAKLKQKLKMGAEGSVIGAGFALLPVAGTLGAKFLGASYKYGLKPAGGAALRVLDNVVVNPLSKKIAGEGTQGGFVTAGLKKTGSLFDNAYGKLGIPDASKWKNFDPKGGTFGQRIMKKLDNFKNEFKSANIMSPTLKLESDKVAGKIEAEMRSFTKIDERIDTKLYDIVSKFKTNYYDKITRQPGYRNIADNLQMEKNKIFDYLTARGTKQATSKLKLVNSAVQKEAKDLKGILKESNTRIGSLLAKNKSGSYAELSRLLVDDADNFFKQRFASFNNRDFKFDLKGKTGIAAKQEIKRQSLMNQDMRAGVEGLENLTFKKLQGFKKKLNSKNPKLTEQEKIWDNALNKNSEMRLELLKRAVINSGSNANVFFENVAMQIGKQANKIKPGEEFPDAIKRFLNTPKGQEVAIKDYSNSMLDAIIWNSKQTYKKQYFDIVEKEWLKDGTIFAGNILKDPAAAQKVVNAGLTSSRLRRVANDQNKSGMMNTDPAFDSTLFTKEYYALPEITNALNGVKANFDNLFDSPWYSSLMQLKAGGQIAKTIFSPMTQIRNVTTASFFPLASGLIGSRSSLGDAWKLVADDIFTGAKNNLDTLNKTIDDDVTRGVIDSSIQVNEIKNILEKASTGQISFNSFMRNPTVKKFVDVYQGGDNIWKIYSDRFYQSALRDAFGNPAANSKAVLDNVKTWYKEVAKAPYIDTSAITGQLKTADEALKEVSAYLVKNTIPTYSQVPRIIQSIRNLPLGNFVAFPAEIMRTSANLLSLGARELTSSNPYIRQMGARRLIGASATFGGMGKIVAETAEFVTGVSDEVMEKAKRSFVPRYEMNATLIPMTAPDENGNFKYINFSYSNPYDSLLRPYNALVSSFAKGELNQENVGEKILNGLFGTYGGAPGAIPEFFSPFISESIGTERVADLVFRNGETRNGKKIWFDTDSLDVKISRGMEHIIGGLEPGGFTSAKRVWNGASGQFTDYGSQRDMANELVALMSGVRVQEVKPLQSMPFVITSFGKDKQEIGRKFNSIAYSANTSAEQKVSAYKEWVVNSFKSQKSLMQTLKDAEDLGIGRSILRRTLDERLKNQTEVSNLLNGKFKAPTASNNRAEALIKRLEDQDLDMALQFEVGLDVAQDVWKDLQRDVRNFDLNSSVEDFETFIDEVLSFGVEQAREVPPMRRTRAIEEVQETDVSLPVDNRKNVAVSPQVTNTGSQVMANATLGSKYLGGINYNKMNTAQKADYVDKVFKV